MFDLPITTYPKLLKVTNEMKGFDLIYALYVEQKKAREDWAQTLWANLDINQVENHSVFTTLDTFFAFNLKLLTFYFFKINFI